MGHNTTVVVMNDAYSSIEGDTDLGKKLVEAIRTLDAGPSRQGVIDVTAGNFIGALRVVEMHHSSVHLPVVVGGNAGVALNLSTIWTPDRDDMECELMFRLAHKHGYTLRKKPR